MRAGMKLHVFADTNNVVVIRLHRILKRTCALFGGGGENFSWGNKPTLVGAESTGSR